MYFKLSINILVTLVLLITLSACGVAPASNTTKKEVSSFGKGIEKLSEDLYLMFGGDGTGSNIGILINQDGVLLIDGKNEALGSEVLAWIRSKTDKPIKYVINTHHHSDHSGGNAFWIKQGATIISQENAQDTDALHQLTFQKNLTLFFGNEKIQIYAVQGHTHNDAFVYLAKNNTLFMGDNYSNDWLPMTRLRGLGNKIIPFAIALTDINTKIIPGHGSMVDKTQLVTFNKLLPLWFEKIKELEQQGLSVDEIIEDQGFLELSKQFNPGTILKPVPKDNMRNSLNSIVSELQK